jgi:hypothetical protein
MIETMRTTLDLDEDVLFAARELASAGGKTMGEVLSELARKALAPKHAMKVRNGVPLLPHRPGRIVTVKMVEDALDQP